MENTRDMVNHPEHYQKHSISLEPIDILEFLPGTIFNCIKYVVRAKDKGNELEDLEKAEFYYNKTIQLFEDNIYKPNLLIFLYPYSYMFYNRLLQNLAKNCTKLFLNNENLLNGWIQFGKELKDEIKRLKLEQLEEAKYV